MKIALIVLGLSLGMGAAGRAAEPTWTLVDQGRSDWHIVIPRAASPAEVHAARELEDFIQQVSGVLIPLVTFDTFGNEYPMYSHEILLGWRSGRVGDNPRMQRVLDENGIKVDYSQLGEEGFLTRTAGPHLVIAGGRPRGTLYGVYTLLEKYLGCRWFDTGISLIPKRRTIELGTLNDLEAPVFRLRDVALGNFRADPDLAARNKVNAGALTDREGGRYGWADPNCHTFNSLLPPDKYFPEHPEYFALVNGKRQRTQPCLTNPDVLRIVTEHVRAWMEKNPDMEVFDVSQNDNDGHCRCPNCQALDDQEDSPQGSLLTFINQVAGAVQKDFPGKYICTFAYAYSEKPPKTIKPAPNVLIRLCSFYNAPMWNHDPRQQEWSGQFADRVIAWSAITKNLTIWDYAQELNHHMMPVPNYHLLAPDLHGFATHGVRGYYAQGALAGRALPLEQLRAYLLAKLAWDSTYDVDQGINEFLAADFGPAAAPIHQYLNLLEQHAPTDPALQEKKPYDAPFEQNWTHLSPTRWWLKPDLLPQYAALWDKAEKLAGRDPVILQRVKVARLELEYAQIRILPTTDPERARIIREFFEVIASTPIQDCGYHICKSSNVYHHVTPADFQAFLDAGGQ